MNTYSDIERLLDRYWEGETTLEEERALKAYFNSGRIDERLRTVAPLFQALREEQKVQLVQPPKVVPLKPALYSWQKIAVAASAALLLSAGMWWWADNADNTAKQVVQQPVVQQEKPVIEEKPVVQPPAAIPDNKQADTPKTGRLAKHNPPKRKKPNTVKPDPETELAMEEIKAALALVSSKMRKGRKEAAKGAIHLEAVDKVFKMKTEG